MARLMAGSATDTENHTAFELTVSSDVGGAGAASRNSPRNEVAVLLVVERLFHFRLWCIRIKKQCTPSFYFFFFCGCYAGTMTVRALASQTKRQMP